MTPMATAAGRDAGWGSASGRQELPGASSCLCAWKLEFVSVTESSGRWCSRTVRGQLSVHTTHKKGTHYEHDIKCAIRVALSSWSCFLPALVCTDVTSVSMSSCSAQLGDCRVLQAHNLCPWNLSPLQGLLAFSIPPTAFVLMHTSVIVGA